MAKKSIKYGNVFTLVTVLLLFCHGITLAATTGKISGKITDVDTGTPLISANIIIDDTYLGGTSDADGDYFIIQIPPGEYSVRASMIGYGIVAQTNVRVEANRTITLDFALTSTVLEGEVVIVQAQREVIKMDVSSSQTSALGEDMIRVPTVRNVTDYLNLTAGVQGMEIRGGGQDQTGFMIDGMEMVDNRSNRPVISVNLSSVKEVSVIKGGFNAEYGNVRSGLINVVTKEGSPRSYHGTFDYRMTPAYQKHEGPSLLGPDNYFTRPYLDDKADLNGISAAFDGTSKGWDKDKRDQNDSFDGWNRFSEGRSKDDDETNDMTPKQARDMFLWEHALEGSAELGQKELQYAHKADWQQELSLSGPIPLIGPALGNLSFFASIRNQYEMFPTPRMYRDGYSEQNTQLKLTSRISRTMKLNIDIMLNDVKTAHRRSEDEEPIDDDYFRSGNEMLDEEMRFIEFTTGEYRYPFDVSRKLIGLRLDWL